MIKFVTRPTVTRWAVNLVFASCSAEIKICSSCGWNRERVSNAAALHLRRGRVFKANSASRFLCALIWFCELHVADAVSFPALSATESWINPELLKHLTVNRFINDFNILSILVLSCISISLSQICPHKWANMPPLRRMCPHSLTVYLSLSLCISCVLLLITPVHVTFPWLPVDQRQALSSPLLLLLLFWSQPCLN